MLPLALISLWYGCSDPGAPTPSAPQGESGGAGGPPAVGGTSPSGGATNGGSGAGVGPETGGNGGAAAGTGGVGPGGSAGAAAGGTPPVAGSGGGPNVPEGEFRIHWIDVEGGAATLLIGPGGETMLIDAGWSAADRDANRILAALDAEIGEPRIDYMLGTHYHVDHVTGVVELVDRATVGTFVDHGPSAEGQGGYFAQWMDAVGDGVRQSVTPGDTIDLGGVAITVVVSAGQVIDPLPGAIADNPECLSSETVNDQLDEDPQSIGILARFGSFDFLALGDLTWGVEHQLACPTNRVGLIDLFQVSQHGSSESNPPQLIHSIAPLAAVSNNGANKGGAAQTFETLFASPGMLDVWQLHRAESNDADHNTEPALIANDAGAQDGQYVFAVVQGDGTFTISNSRNGETRQYTSR